MPFEPKHQTCIVVQHYRCLLVLGAEGNPSFLFKKRKGLRARSARHVHELKSRGYTRGWSCLATVLSSKSCDHSSTAICEWLGGCGRSHSIGSLHQLGIALAPASDVDHVPAPALATYQCANVIVVALPPFAVSGFPEGSSVKLKGFE